MSFYITLPSDSSMGLFPNNTISKYRTFLPEKVQLQGPYEVGLAEISYPRTWDNLPNDCILALKYSGSNPDIRKALPFRILVQKGSYESVNDIINVINTSITELMNNLETSDVLFPVNIQYSKHTRRVNICVLQDYAFVIPGTLALLLGLTRNPNHGIMVQNGCYSKYAVDLNIGLHSLFIYSDVIQRRPVGDGHVPLLRIVSVQGQNGETIEKDFTKPHYLPLATNSFQTIEINIMDETGEPVKFETGKVHVTLHFRPRRLWTSL